VIMGGLNEGIWPPDTGTDPWMSRPMRQEFGLPGLERSIGLSAHDFVQGFCASEVVLTRARKVGGAPSVPSRWLLRMDAVLQAAGYDADGLLCDVDAQYWARTIDYTDEFMPALRPAPKPLVSARPRRLSVTRVEMWLRDPYTIYASHILKLKKLNPPQQQVDAAVRGNVLHDVLDRYVSAYPDDLPQDGVDILCGFARDVLHDYGADEGEWRFWWPRFERLAGWYEMHERHWRDGAKPLVSEVRGEMRLSAPAGDFVLSARVDRIDKTVQGMAAIIDYKSGGSYAKSALAKGELPQLPLEALILAEGGFEGAGKMESVYLGYWVMRTGRNPGNIVCVEEGVGDLATQIYGDLKVLIERFDDADTPYLSLPRPDQAPRYNDYLHLARVAEWAALDDVESTEAA